MKNLILVLMILMSSGAYTQDAKSIGAIFDYSEPIDMNTAITKSLDQNVAVNADVKGVCQVKGCWMTLSDQSTDEEVFVKFKDYGFFMPLDLAGGQVIVHGVISKSITTVDELRHYAEDAGKTKEEIEAITEPKDEFTMMADGVVILN